MWKIFEIYDKITCRKILIFLSIDGCSKMIIVDDDNLGYKILDKKGKLYLLALKNALLWADD